MASLNEILRNSVASSEKTLAFPQLPMVPAGDNTHTFASTSPSESTQPPPRPYLPQDLDSFEDDIDADPQSHFLSPMASYEYWDDSDDEDGEPVEWDAGIVDFGLFYDDHKEADVPLPSKWNDLIADQARAYQESVKRTRIETVEPEFLARTGSGESLPGLTPDSSPLVKNDLEYESESEATSIPHPNTPAFKLVVTPPLEEVEAALAEAAADTESDDEEDYLPLDFFVKRSQAQRSMPEHPAPFSRPPLPFTQPPLVRPGMRFDRTMSGKRHSWIKPSRGIWSIKEGVDEDTAVGVTSGDKNRRPLRRGRSW